MAGLLPPPRWAEASYCTKCRFSSDNYHSHQSGVQLANVPICKDEKAIINMCALRKGKKRRSSLIGRSAEVRLILPHLCQSATH